MKKRFLNLLLVLVMMICVLPFAASADTTCDHDFSVEVEVVSEPNCTERGIVRFKCKYCEETEKRNELPAKGHTEVEIPAKAATCTTRAKTAGTKCSVCNEDLVAQKNTGTALGHTFTELVERKEPTCTVDGHEVYKCVRCDETETKVLEKLGHDITADPATLKEITTNPSCKNTGKGKYGCTRCNAWSILDVPVVACEAKEVPAVEATCEGTGLTAGTKCRFCGKVMKAQEEVDALGHDYKFNRVTRTATCKVKGQEQHICTRCGDAKYVATPLAACTPVVTAGVPATCTEGGLKDGTKCSVCEKILLSREDIPALGHDYQFKRITRNATCTENGQEQHECTRCGDKIYKKIVASGHNYEFARYSVGNEPTCTKGGVERYQCTICKEMGEDKVVGPLGHVEVELERWEPTCTKDGIKETKCSRCNLIVRERIEALGHTEIAVTGTPASCTATGLTDGTKCSVCGEVLVKQEVAAKLRHDWKPEDAKDPTCKDEGYNAHMKCSVCGETDGKTVIPANAEKHEFENYKCTLCGTYDPEHEHEKTVVGTAPATCTADGSSSYKCGECGYEWDEAIPTGGHSYTNGKCSACGAADPGHTHTYTQTGYTAPTCTAEGLLTEKCSVCNDEKQSTIKALGHSYEDGICSRCEAADPDTVCRHTNCGTEIFDVTCTTDGYETTVCYDCGEEIGERVVIPATGHDHVNGICSNCGHKDKNRITNDYQDVHIVG